MNRTSGRIGGILALCALALIVVVYMRVHGYGYVWDDKALFIDSAVLRGPWSLSALTQPILPGTMYFRPLVLGSFMLEFHLLGMDPGISHVVNLLIHLANTSMVGGIAVLLLRSAGARARWRAPLAMLLYGLHPILVEPVVWVAGRFDLLVAFFSLLGLLALLLPWRRGYGYAIATVAFLAAALSKEMALVFPVLAFIVLWAKEAPGASFAGYLLPFLRRHWPLVVAVAAAGLFYLLLRFGAQQHGRLGDALPPPFHHLVLVGYTIAFYLHGLVWPFSQMSEMHPLDLMALSPLQQSVGVVMVLLYIALVALALSGRFGRAGLLLLGFLLGLLPVLNIVPLGLGGNIAHGRFLALPLALAVIGIVQIEWRRLPLSEAMEAALPKVAGAVMGLWMAFGVMNINITVPMWANDLVLWSWLHKSYPDNKLVSFNHLSSLMQFGQLEQLDKVIHQIKGRRALSDDEWLVYANYLAAEERYQDAFEALTHYQVPGWMPHLEMIRRGISLDDAHANKSLDRVYDYRNLYQITGYVYFKLGKYPQALQAARIMRFYDGAGFAPTWVMLGRAYYGVGEFGKGDEAFNKAAGMFITSSHADVARWREEALREVCAHPELAARKRCRQRPAVAIQ